MGRTIKIEELDKGDIPLTITTCNEPKLMAWVRSFGKKRCSLV